jgi:hypothetical protein
MSLDNIQLQPVAIQDLYKQSLVELKSKPQADTTNTASSLIILGKNLKRIVIVVSNPEVAYLEDDELNFLLGILSACKLTMDDVCIVNVAKNSGTNYSSIAAELNAEKVFLFGTSPGKIKLPLAFPDYQVQQYNNQVYLSAPALSGLQHDKAEKTKLWNCLKQIFSI